MTKLSKSLSFRPIAALERRPRFRILTSSVRIYKDKELKRLVVSFLHSKLFSNDSNNNNNQRQHGRRQLQHGELRSRVAELRVSWWDERVSNHAVVLFHAVILC